MVFSNRTKTVTAFVFLWAARDISCEAPSVREEAEEDKVKSFGAWYNSRIYILGRYRETKYLYREFSDKFMHEAFRPSA